MIRERVYVKRQWSGTVYPHSVEYLRRCHVEGVRLYVYSSSPVAAH
jgi:methionine salvage enolase-phosphatase E1